MTESPNLPWPLRPHGKGSLARRRWRLYLEQDGLCFYCREPMTFHRACRDATSKRITTDHLIPLSKGGRYRYGNEVAACFACNNARGDADWLVFFKQLAVLRGEPDAEPPRYPADDATHGGARTAKTNEP